MLQNQSALMSSLVTPASIAFPMIAGMTDWATIQMVPNVTPPRIVGLCPRATHQR